MRWHVLADLINACDLRVGAEVGTKDGKNIRQLLKLCPQIEHIAAIDWFESRENRRSVEQLDRVEIHPGTSWEVAESFPDGCFDWAFIDAGHDYESVNRDIEAYQAKVKGGGWLVGHDYGTTRFPGVTEAVHKHFPAVIIERRNPNRCGIWMIQM